MNVSPSKTLNKSPAKQPAGIKVLPVPQTPPAGNKKVDSQAPANAKVVPPAKKGGATLKITSNPKESVQISSSGAIEPKKRGKNIQIKQLFRSQERSGKRHWWYQQTRFSCRSPQGCRKEVRTSSGFGPNLFLDLHLQSSERGEA